MPPSSSGLGLRPLTAPTPVQIRLEVRLTERLTLRLPLGYGVIGNTGDSGSSILGSSPGTPANASRCEAFFISGNGEVIMVDTQVGDIQSWRTNSLSVSARLGAFTFHRSGKFRVLHVADVQDGAKPSKDTATLIATACDAGRPDLVIFTGNIIAGYAAGFAQTFRRRSWMPSIADQATEAERTEYLAETRKLVHTIYSNLLKPLVDRGIPFAMTFGNHDVQCGLSTDELERIAGLFPGCMNTALREYMPQQPVLEHWHCGAGTFAMPVLDTQGRIMCALALVRAGDFAQGGGYCGPDEQTLQWMRELPTVLPQGVQTLVFQHLPLAMYYQALSEAEAGTAYAVEGYRAFEGKYYVLDAARTEPASFLGEGISCAEQPDEDAVIAAGGYAGVFAGHDHRNGFVSRVRVGEGDAAHDVLCAATPTCGFDTYGPSLGKRAVRLIEFDIRHPYNPRTQLLEFGAMGERPKASQAYTYSIERVNTTPGRGWNLVYKSGLFQKEN